ncbi:MAG: iron complex outermembrane receptor protein [Cellvibrionaceae bacterium]|jgi:iron complex outermembrane receptor protein
MPRLFIIFLLLPVLSYSVELDEFILEDIETNYLSPTRLKQTPHDTPASVSRITHETIKKLQINNLPDVFRYIAGMVTIKPDGGRYRINYHGTNGLQPTRMQIFIDGIPVERPRYAQIIWSTLPISISDIDYIEVTRSPSAATYGTNSLTAIINIVTKDALNSSPFSASASTGGNDSNRLTLSFSGKPAENISYRVSASANSDDGYDQFVISRPGAATQFERSDDYGVRLINSKVNFRINNVTKASLGFYHSDREKHNATGSPMRLRTDEFRLPQGSTESNYLSGELMHTISPKHDIKIKGGYTRINRNNPIFIRAPTAFFSRPLLRLSRISSCYTSILLNDEEVLNLAKAEDNEMEIVDWIDDLTDRLSANDNCSIDSGSSREAKGLLLAFINELKRSLPADETFGFYGLRTEGDIDASSLEEKLHIEFQDTYLFNEDRRLVSGFGLARQKLDSDFYIQGEALSTTYRLFGNLEERWQQWVFNAGVMFEHNDDITNEPALSPRLGANYRINDDSTIRFVLSKAVRIPDLFDYNLSWPPFPYTTNFNNAYEYGDDEPYTEGEVFFSSLNSITESDEILAREISFYTKKRLLYANRYIDFDSDFKWFYNSLSETPEYFKTHYLPEKSEATLKGFEVDANFSLNEISSQYFKSLDFHLNYTYLDHETENSIDLSLFPRHSGSLYSIFSFKNNWFSSLSYYGNSAIGEESFEAYELGLGKDIKLNPGSLTISGKFIYQPDKTEKISFEDENPDESPGFISNSNNSSVTFFLNIDFKL